MKFFYAGDKMLILLGMISCHINMLHEALLCRGSDAHTARDDILPHQHVTWSSSMQGTRCSYCSGWYPVTSTCYMKFFCAGDQMLILLGMISCHINLLHEVLLCRESDAHTARDDILSHQLVTWSSSMEGIRCSYCSGWYPATSICYMKFFYGGDQMLILLGMISCHINMLHEVLLCRGSDAHTARDDILPHQHVRSDMQRQESVVSARTPEDGVFRRGETDLPCHIQVHARVSNFIFKVVNIWSD